MLEFSSSRPLAIKGLILIANKNSDYELFSNMLNYAKNFKIPLEFFLIEAVRFCMKNGKWIMLREYTNQPLKGLGKKVKNAISFLNFNLAKESIEEGRPEKAKRVKILQNKVVTLYGSSLLRWILIVRSYPCTPRTVGLDGRQKKGVFARVRH